MTNDKAIQMESDDAVYFANRAITHMAMGNKEKALADNNEALRLDPKNTDALGNRAGVYLAMGNKEKAIADYTAEIQLDPKNSGAYQNRAWAYTAGKNYDKAIADMRRAIELGPDDAQAFNALAWVYATCPQAQFRDGAKAIELATKACELSKWKKPWLIDTLAAAEAESGKFDDAVKHSTQALEMSKTDKEVDKEMLDEMTDAFEHFQKKQPYRYESK